MPTHEELGLPESSRVLRLVYSEHRGMTGALIQTPGGTTQLLARGPGEPRYSPVETGLPADGQLTDVCAPTGVDAWVCLGSIPFNPVGRSWVCRVVFFSGQPSVPIDVTSYSKGRISRLLGAAGEPGWFLCVVGLQRPDEERPSRISIDYKICRVKVSSQELVVLSDAIGPSF